jgi:hypothetical protein
MYQSRVVYGRVGHGRVGYRWEGCRVLDDRGFLDP